MPTFRKKSEVNNSRVKSGCYEDLGFKTHWKFRSNPQLSDLNSQPLHPLNQQRTQKDSEAEEHFHGSRPPAMPGFFRQHREMLSNVTCKDAVARESRFTFWE